MLQLSKETVIVGLLVSGVGTGNAYVQSNYVSPGHVPTGVQSACYSSMPGVTTELYTAEECRRELLERSSGAEHLLHLLAADDLSRGSYELLVRYIKLVGQDRFLELPIADDVANRNTVGINRFLNEIAL